MLLLKVTALTSAFSLLLSILLELYFGLTQRPYLFGFPHTRWPLYAAIALIWAASFRAAHYFVFERLTFYGG